MSEPWTVKICDRGFVVVSRHGGVLGKRWHWANHPEGDRRRRPDVGMWVCGSRRLVFQDYRRAARTAGRLNACFRWWQRYYEGRKQ